MKIAHWCTTIEGMAGLTHRVREMIEIEKEFGHDSRVLSTSFKDGKKQETIAFESWTWAEQSDVVNVIDSHVPINFDNLHNRVFITHGAPYHCATSEMFGKTHPLATSILMVQQCELTITWNPHHAPIWKEFGGNVKTIIGGVDLKKWTPEGPKVPFVSHPTIVVLDTPRDNKLPTQIPFALMKVHREIPSLRFEWIAIPQQMYPFWMLIVKAIGIDTFTHAVPYAVSNPADYYRGADLIIHPVSSGSIGGVGLEALACGCPVMIFEGEDEKECSAKCREFDCDDMAAKIIDVWERTKKDPNGIRREARLIAERNYDLRRSVKEMLNAYGELF